LKIGRKRRAFAAAAIDADGCALCRMSKKLHNSEMWRKMRRPRNSRFAGNRADCLAAPNVGSTALVADAVVSEYKTATPAIQRKKSWISVARHRSIVGFLFALPLILVIVLLVAYPAGYAIHLATLNKSMKQFVGLGNFFFLFKQQTFWAVVEQSCLFAITAVIFKAVVGFVVAHFVHNIPQKGQRKWRGMLLVPWVIPPAMSTLAWLWLFDPSYSAFNWVLQHLGMGPVPWLGNPYWARFCVILVNVWVGSPFFMIMYLAALKSVPEALHEAAAIDGANWLQKIWYINLPMMRNIIQITALFSLIVTFANFDIVRILTQGGPIDTTHVFGTWAFLRAIQGNDIPLGAAVSLFMAPILAVAAFFILRNVRKRGNEA
jgi:multiple sugar transport system permease protein